MTALEKGNLVEIKNGVEVMSDSDDRRALEFLLDEPLDLYFSFVINAAEISATGI